MSPTDKKQIAAGVSAVLDELRETLLDGHVPADAECADKFSCPGKFTCGPNHKCDANDFDCTRRYICTQNFSG